jgi:flavin-dependent dehydrogenase
MDGAARTVRAGVVIGADGLRSTVGSLVRAPLTRLGRHATATIYGYWSGLDVDGYHWYWRRGAAAGAIPTNGGETLVFAAAPARRFVEEMRGDVPGAYRRLLAGGAPELAERLSGAQIVGSLRGFPGHPGHLRRPWGPGWALVGDAAYFKDPITAHGLSDALRDAELLARAVVRGGEGALAGYEAARDELSTRLFDLTDRIASVEWDNTELKALHRSLSDEMKREVSALVELGEAPAEPTRRTA